MFGRGSKAGSSKKSEDVKKSAGKVLDTKKDTATRAKVRRTAWGSAKEYVKCWKGVKSVSETCWMNEGWSVVVRRGV